MSVNRNGLRSDLEKVDAHVIQSEEYDEIPEVTEAMFARGQIMEGGKPVRGRPKAEAPKKMTTIRLDADVLDFYRATGPGWQGRVNQLLRKAAGL